MGLLPKLIPEQTCTASKVLCFPRILEQKRDCSQSLKGWHLSHSPHCTSEGLRMGSVRNAKFETQNTGKLIFFDIVQGGWRKWVGWENPPSGFHSDKTHLNRFALNILTATKIASQRQRNLKTQQLPVIFDLCLKKTRVGEPRYYRDVINFEKLRFQNVF